MRSYQYVFAPGRSRPLALLVAAGLLLNHSSGQTNATAGSDSVLQRRYESAQRFQASHDLPHAAEQYRIFIADCLGQIAVNRAHAGEYDKAADDFDEALSLVPKFPMLRLEYARAALSQGNLEHAKLLAGAIIETESGPGGNRKIAASAHVVLGRVLRKNNKNAEAKREFEAAVALDPSFENGYELAVADLDLGDHDGAAQIFKEMMSSFGDTAEMHLYFGQAYGSSDFQADAVREFQEAIAKDKQLPGVHYSLAAAYLATSGSSKLAEAERELREEIALAPGNAAAYAALGHLLAEQHTGSTAEAEADLHRATTLDPKNPDPFLFLGQLYADSKRTDEAKAALRHSIELTRDVSRNAFQVQKAHYLLGRLLMQTGSPEEGKQEIAAAQTLMQQNLSRDQSRLADYLQEDKPATTPKTGPQMPMAVEEKTQDPEMARKLDVFEKQVGPAIADSYNNLGAIAGSEGDPRAALHYFQRTAEWNPALPGLDENWGRAAFQAGAFPRAIPLLSRALQQHPGDDTVRASLGISQYMTRDYSAAKNTLRPLDAKGNASPEVEYAYAESLEETGELNDAVPRLLLLEKAHPNVAEVHRALGKAYAAARTPGAAAELETAIRLNPKDAESHAALGRLQMSHGKAKEAVENLQIALKLEPDNATFRQELAEADRKVRRN